MSRFGRERRRSSTSVMYATGFGAVLHAGRDDRIATLEVLARLLVPDEDAVLPTEREPA
jgi:hypothetical protein